MMIHLHMLKINWKKNINKIVLIGTTKISIVLLIETKYNNYCSIVSSVCFIRKMQYIWRKCIDFILALKDFKAKNNRTKNMD